jgi:putative transcriptional regulator
MLINRFSRLIGERRVSVKEVALATGISRTTLHDLYHDRSSRIDFATIDRLCSYFRVTTQELLEWVPAQEAQPQSGEAAADGSQR